MTALLAKVSFPGRLSGLNEPIGLAASQALERCLEMALLAHPTIAEVAAYWDLYLGKHEEVIEKRLTAILGSPPKRDLTKMVFDCLGSFNARRGQRGIIDPESELTCFERFLAASPNRDLRCECCGYHFRETDLNSRRRSIAGELDLTLARFVDPRRQTDDLKPLHSKARDFYYTALELDHALPQAGLGPSSPDNARILCRFCNVGKLMFRYPLEPFPLCNANSLVSTYSDTFSPQSAVTATVAALRINGGVCSRTGRKKSEVELTARLSPKRWENADWLVPWSLDVVSYEAFTPDEY